MGNFQIERAASKQNSVPERLHHSAYVCRDLEATRKLYEDVLGSGQAPQRSFVPPL